MASFLVDWGEVEFAIEKEGPDMVGYVELVGFFIVVGSPVLAVPIAGSISTSVLETMSCDGGCYGSGFALLGGC